MRVAAVVAVLATSLLVLAPSAAYAHPCLAGSASSTDPSELAPPGLAPVVAAPPARAVTPPSASRAATSSYTGTVLVVDAVALGMFYYGLSDSYGEAGERYIPLGLVSYAFGGPIVHLVKNRPGMAAASLTFRVAMPLAGAYLAAERDCCGDNDAVTVGVIVGTLGAAALDAFYFAKVDAPKREQPSWQPTARVASKGFALGVAGTF